MNVLILSTQFPYPPRSGFEMRVYQLMRLLATRHDVTLISFVEPGDRDDVTSLADQVRVRPVALQRGSVAGKRVGQLLSLLSPKPYACRNVYAEEMQQAITELCSNGEFDVVQLESSVFCQYEFPEGVKVVLDEHNIEYELLWRMWQSERSLARRVFNRIEYQRFRRFEQRAWRKVDGCIVTSGREVAIVRASAPEVPIEVVPNGVDLAYFAPAAEPPKPYTLVFNGVLDYRPNLDAALFLAQEIWPLVVARCPEARLSIVGRNAGVDLRDLRRPGIELIGEVPDIRPYIQGAAAVVVPIRMGGGTRLKVVEALSMGKAIVSTSLGCEGISVRDGEHLLVADDAKAFAARIVDVLESPDLGAALGRAGRRLAEREYSWELSADQIDALYGSLVGELAAPVS